MFIFEFNSLIEILLIASPYYIGCVCNFTKWCILSSFFFFQLNMLFQSVNAAEAGLVHLKHKVDRFEQSSEISSEHLSNLRSAMDELQEKITTLVSEVVS